MEMDRNDEAEGMSIGEGWFSRLSLSMYLVIHASMHREKKEMLR